MDTITSYVSDDLMQLELAPAPKIILVALSTFKNGYYSTMNNLALKVNMPRRTIQRSLKTLKERGYVYIDETDVGNIKLLTTNIMKDAEKVRVESMQPTLLKKMQKKSKAKKVDPVENSLEPVENSVERVTNSHMGATNCHRGCDNLSHSYNKDLNIDKNKYIYRSDLNSKKQGEVFENQAHELELQEQTVALKPQNQKVRIIKKNVRGIELFITYDERGEMINSEFVDYEHAFDNIDEKNNKNEVITSTLRQTLSDIYKLSASDVEQLIEKMHSYYVKDGTWRYQRGNRKEISISQLSKLCVYWVNNLRKTRQRIKQQSDCVYEEPLTAQQDSCTLSHPTSLANNRDSDSVHGCQDTGKAQMQMPSVLTKEMLANSEYMSALIAQYGADAVNRQVWRGVF